MRNMDCPKCNARMEQGYLPDLGHSSYKLTGWAPGKPRWATLFRQRISLKMHRVKTVEIESWRCTRCGYLENYAPDRPSA